MINDLEVETIQDLLNKGLPCTTVASLTGWGESTVRYIRDGEIDLEKRAKKALDVQYNIEALALIQRPYSRCSICGHKVQKPCLKCALDANDIRALMPILMIEGVDDE